MLMLLIHKIPFDEELISLQTGKLAKSSARLQMEFIQLGRALMFLSSKVLPEHIATARYFARTVCPLQCFKSIQIANKWEITFLGHCFSMTIGHNCLVLSFLFAQRLTSQNECAS
jgi:hypothetical protein